MRKINLLAVFVSIVLGAASVRAETLSVFMTENEFRQLATLLARKVNLFREVWDQDRNAEFFGGTTRDYLYWL